MNVPLMKVIYNNFLYFMCVICVLYFLHIIKLKKKKNLNIFIFIHSIVKSYLII